MASVSTERNPFIRRSFGQRAMDGLKIIPQLPGRLWRGFRNWPKQLRYTFTIMGLVALCGTSIMGVRFILKRNEEAAIRDLWVAIENEFRTTADVSKIRESLDRILALRPDDVHARAKRDALERGESIPTEPGLWMLIIRDHARNQRLAELEREARRRLAAEPRDYYAHYLLAKLTLNRQDLRGADQHLNALAEPEAHPINIQYDSLADAVMLLRMTGKDANRLRGFLAQRINPDIRKDSMVQAPPELQVILLQLFLDTFDLPRVPQDAGLAWPNARRIYNAAFQAAQEKQAIPLQRQCAILGSRMIAALTLLKNTNQLSESEQTTQAAELEQTVRIAWKSVIDRQPASHEAYLGLMESHARTGQIAEAIEVLLKGLDRCGDQPQLLEAYWSVAMQTNTAAGYARLLQAAQRNPKMPRYWVAAARAAAAMDRRDLAFNAIKNAREHTPDDIEVNVMHAVLYSGTGYPHKVLEQLTFLNDIDIPRYPHVCALYSRALLEIGDDERLEEFLERVAAFSRDQNRPEPHYYAALGLLQADPPSATAALRAASFLRPAVDKWRVEFPPLSQLLARCLSKAIELQGPDYDREVAAQAVLACERAAMLDPRHAQTAADLVFLRIRTQRDAARGLADAGPLLARLDSLTPEQAEVLGMAFNAAERFDEAIRVIQPYTVMRATAGCWVQLAMAFIGQGRHAEAEQALSNANQISMNRRERADYLAARSLLSKVKQ